jgi:predicted metal-dependent phosphoesterase TrpH
VNIDLHIHSTASDGSLTPTEIIAKARQQRLAAIAITDHDTVAGVAAVMARALPSDLQFISGVEISTAAPASFPCQGSLHLLGYGVNPKDSHLQDALRRLQNARRDRTPRIIARLNQLGIGITLADLEAAAGDVQLGRPHIANYLINKGIVDNFDEAFEQYLGVGRPGYADKYRIGCEDAIQLIRNAGGVPVLAHPALIVPRGTWRLEALVAALKTAGLVGLEAYYPEHTVIQTQTFLSWVKQYALVATGGTDYHGHMRPGVDMGIAGGDFNVPYHCFTALKRRLIKIQSDGGEQDRREADLAPHDPPTQ